ncbi:MAG TPA: non-canonical purine NTP pyrophosphatase [Candidatus Paceibacterota bacterium]|nr:non-canonical purine NTP pyrophosphatase [Candidatus Paceibacterota bacterium]
MKPKKPKLFIVTGSDFKFKDLSTGLNEFFDCEQKDWNEPEIQGDPEDIIRHKIKTAYEVFKQPVLVDDVSVHVGELNGFPGPYMKDFWKCFTPEEFGLKFAGSRIKAICRLGLCRKEGEVIIAKGEFNGKIIVPKNNDHHGRFFEIFAQLDGMPKPMINYTTEEKNEFSHRGKAMKNLLKILQKDKK